MAYDCRVYRILIASPSDVEEEREIAVKVIQQWNDLYSYSRKVVLLPLRWETHTAPEYGTRPQEVINRAIVDECDLLVGIFWTRIGSPTGSADSGTLEEIERVGKAEKPIMLYFSRVEIDPDRIDLDQIEKLKQFKEKTYPKGLVESYKRIIEFRDKFANQLELKLRDLQRSDASWELPLTLEFLNVESGESIGSSLNHVFDHPNVSDFNVLPIEERDALKPFAEAAIKAKSYFPIALVIKNSSPSGIRNLYVELNFSATSDKLEVTDSPEERLYRTSTIVSAFLSQTMWETRPSKILKRVGRKLAKFDADKLQRTDRGWRLSFEWEALQPQRIRLVKPVLYVYSPESATLSFNAKVFADSFPEPFVLEANVSIEAKQSPIDLINLLPDWRKLLDEVVSPKDAILVGQNLRDKSDTEKD
jgi:hypothetical protein